MAHNPVIWFEIYVQDLDRARHFYERVLGLKLQRIEGDALEMWAFPMEMGREGAGGALVKMPDVASGGNSTLVYFSCEDCALEESRVLAAGGQVKQTKMSIAPHGFISLVVDTEGNLCGLHSMK